MIDFLGCDGGIIYKQLFTLKRNAVRECEPACVLLEYIHTLVQMPVEDLRRHFLKWYKDLLEARMTARYVRRLCRVQASKASSDHKHMNANSQVRVTVELHYL